MPRLLLVLASMAATIVLVSWLCGDARSHAPRWTAPRGAASGSGASWSLAGHVDRGDAGTAFAADGDVDPRPGSGRLAGEIRARLCPAAAQIVCEGRRRAGCREAAPWMDPEDLANAQSCPEYVAWLCDGWVTRHYGEIDDRFVLDEAALALCLDVIESDARTATQMTLGGPCDELAADPARVGEACSFSWYTCGAGRCIDGTCVANARRGEPCTDTPCGAELVCVAGICEPPTPHGAPCDADSICAERTDACIDGTCASHVADGGACAIDEECGTARRCLESRCTRVPSTTCSLEYDCGRGRSCHGQFEARCEMPSWRGRACTGSSDCEPLACVEGVCDSGMAHEYGSLRAGDDCTYGGLSDGCSRGLACAYDESTSTFRCALPAAIGASCEGSQVCAYEALCVWRTRAGVCEPQLCGVADYFVDLGED